MKQSKSQEEKIVIYPFSGSVGHSLETEQLTCAKVNCS